MSMVGRIATLPREKRAVALIEFAIVLPVVALAFMALAELTNFIVTKERVSQLALQLADNASRMGSGSQLAQKTISEGDINDLLTGAKVQGTGLDFYNRARVVVSDLEPMATPNTSGKYKIVWQRCRGSKTYAPAYGTAGQTNVTGMGPTGRQAFAYDGGATMFVEVAYDYRPLIASRWAPAATFTEIAAMVVRDDRDLSKVYPTANTTTSSC